MAARPSPPKPWERAAAFTAGSASTAPPPVADGKQNGTQAAQSPFAGLAAGVAPYAPPGSYGASTSYGAGGAYGTVGTYGSGAAYGPGYGSGYGVAGAYSGAGYPAAGYGSSYGGVGYGSYGGPYTAGFGGGSPFYRPGLLGGGFGGPGDPSQLFPDMLGGGLRKLENAMFTFGRLTQLLEMNLETVLRFIGSLAAFGERMHSVSGEFSSLTSSVHRRSIEFGQRSMARLRQVRVDRRRLIAALFFVLALALRWGGRAGRPQRRRQAMYGQVPALAARDIGGATAEQLWQLSGR